ncbi:MAG: DUF1592 domain-containing protein [Deltaproteobacteria bacterium]|nr:DUF1592 domain-containing protein [Deltaproteobacteria bacterium]
MKFTVKLHLGSALALLFAACSGAVSGDGTGDGFGAQGGGGGRSGGGPGATHACPKAGAADPGASPLRRLSKVEYNNTVADLLGDTSEPANAFPPESRVHGFDNQVTTQTVTYTLADYMFKTAEQLANRAITKLDTLYSCDVAKLGEMTCAQTFVRDFGKRAYRRPLLAAEETSLMGTYTKGRQTGDFKNGLRLVITRLLASPHFLYRPELGDAGAANARGAVPLTAYEVASRLSYLLWGTMPDQTLFDAADKNELSTANQVSSHVARMMNDPKAKAAVRRFYSGWLMLDRLAQSSKDEKLFPGYGAVVPSMMEEITRTMDDVIWGDDASVTKLFTTDYTFANRDLASFVGLSNAASMNKDFARVSLSPQGPGGASQRMGILATPGLLAAQSKPQETSPVLRGRFVLEQMLCMELPLPPAGVPPLEAVDTSALTTRERFEQHAESACASCHKFLDPIGFAFENFDAAGRYRSTEKNKPINTSGTLTETDVDGAFDNAVGLTNLLAKSERVRECIAKQWFRFAMGRNETDEAERGLGQLACGFRGDEANLNTLLGAVTQTDAFLYKTAGAKP